jgi:hypothetical protein
MAENPVTTQGGGELDHNVDRYPSLLDVLTQIVEDDAIPDTAIERLEITALASGQATYRYWEPRAEDPEGGVLSFE